MSRILIVLSSHDQLGSTGRATGWYLPEAAHPWKIFTEANIDIEFVSPKGGRNRMDGVDLEDAIQAEFLTTFGDTGPDTHRPDQVDPSQFDAVLYVGGHGTMWDFANNTALAGIARDIYEADGIVSAVCHGPAGLVNITLSDGTYLVAGKQLAAFTNDEEAAVGLTDVVPFLLADALTGHGAQHIPAANFAANTIVDGRLITGQNPASAVGVAEAIVQALVTSRTSV
ncbi:type 1 glutamine amidotransferase domain-containing protein [Frigoribacterium sp. UYMn621]|uniref:type 1 glutamine amidotransferase domain-containing protein n=1 Tax=Frigoribacterium sp. UYMn621 TaxID=3156343 RepID=UPI003391C7DE